MVARMSKLMAETVKRLADCVSGSDKMKSREHLQACIDSLNMSLTDEAVNKLLEELAVDLGEEDEDEGGG